MKGLHLGLLGPLVVSVAAGCAPPLTTGPGLTDGTRLYDFFPFEPAGREWSFATDAVDVPYRLEVLQGETAEAVEDDVNIWTLTVSAVCFSDAGACGDTDDDSKTRDIEEEPLDVWRMSSDFVGGVRVWEMGGVVYDPPIVLGEGRAQFDQVVTTEASGATFASTFEGLDPCPGDYFEVDEESGESRVDCATLTVDDGGAGTAVAGSWLGVPRIGLARFTRTIDGLTWSLRRFEEQDQ